MIRKINGLDWREVYFGHVHTWEVKKYIKNPEWQRLRSELKGTSLYNRYESLRAWLRANGYSREAQVQVTNYITALSRGGMIKPEDYR